MAVRDRILAVMEWAGLEQADVVRRSGMSRDWVSRRIGVDKKTGLPRGGGIQADEVEVFAKALQVTPCALIDDGELQRAFEPRTTVPSAFTEAFEHQGAERMLVDFNALQDLTANEAAIVSDVIASLRRNRPS